MGTISVYLPVYLCVYVSIYLPTDKFTNEKGNTMLTGGTN